MKKIQALNNKTSCSNSDKLLFIIYYNILIYDNSYSVYGSTIFSFVVIKKKFFLSCASVVSHV